MKQIKTWLTAITALLYSITASAHDSEVNGIYYNITSSTNLTVEVTYKGDSYEDFQNEYNGAVVIPSSISYNSKVYNVENLGLQAFRGCNNLTSITIPDGVTSIGSYTFYGCTSLTSITIPEVMTSIGSYTFYDCTSLTSITIPDGVTSIGSYTFQYCI